MPTIRPSAELRNKYNEISEFCHTYAEPVFITKNGKGDLVVLSIDVYEKLSGKSQLCQLIEEGSLAESEGKTKTAKEAVEGIRKRLLK